MTTDQPYTDEDLRAEAARQHAELAEDPDFMGIGERMQDAYVGSTLTDDEGQTWENLLPSERDGGEAYNTAQRKIHDLIKGAADVSDWAVELGAEGLVPTRHHLIDDAESGVIAAVQVALPQSVELSSEALADIAAVIREDIDPS